ncbi:unnamed protein product, partial [Brassica oleracea var. botrytis]
IVKIEKKLDRLVWNLGRVNKWRPEYEDREEDLLLLDNNFCIT